MTRKTYVPVNFLLLTLIVILAILLRPENQSFKIEPVQNFTTRAHEHGYLADEHNIVTDDGYILKAFRMRKRSCLNQLRGPPVILQHGLLMSSDGWLDAGPGVALGYLIADACFDMWVTNCRGNYHARRHVALDPDKDAKFWHWSTDEIGKYDVPAIIDYVLEYTGNSKLNYIGFSQGAGTFFIMCSERPEYCGKVQLLIGLSPASRQLNSGSPFYRFSTTAFESYRRILTGLGVNEVLAKGDFSQKFFEFICPINSLTLRFCAGALSVLDSSHEGSISNETKVVLYNHFPAGTSLQNMAWYGQGMTMDNFGKFDFGKQKNLLVYGEATPPVYNLTTVTTPTVLIYGKNDKLVDAKDVEWLRDRLPNVLQSVMVEDPEWNHMDMVYSRHISEKVFPKVEKYLNQLSYLQSNSFK